MGKPVKLVAGSGGIDWGQEGARWKEGAEARGGLWVKTNENSPTAPTWEELGGA